MFKNIFYLFNVGLLISYPVIAMPEIKANASIGYYFSVAIEMKNYNNNCLIVDNAAVYSTNELDAKKGALVACGANCKSVVTFAAVN